MTNSNRRSITQKIGLALGPVLFGLIIALDISPDNQIAGRMAATAILMAAWWMTEALPLATTAMIPVILYPFLGIMDVKDASSVYFNSTIFLFLGGFMIALAMQKWNLHKRVSLFIIKKIGGGPGRIIFGFMLASAAMSMFISNTATTIMMLPIGLAIILKLEESFPDEVTHKFSVALMLGIAFASSVGGIATLVGTAPNLAFQRIFALTFPDAPSITFGHWIILGFPLAMIMMVIIWVVLTKIFYKPSHELNIDINIINSEYKSLGPMSYEEKIVFYVLASTALLWIFRQEINLGWLAIPGWSGIFSFAKYIDDGTVAILTSSLLFIIPTKSKKIASVAILDNKVFAKLPWDIVLLFGGGFAIAKGFQDTGLSTLLGDQFAGLAGTSPVLLMVLVCFGLTFLTELTSNTATTHTILPILASLSVALQINPMILMIPATLSASFAFMLPVATPPNAIVFSSGRVKIGEMVRVGIVINIIGIIVTSVVFYLIGTVVFGIDMNVFPAWAGK